MRKIPIVILAAAVLLAFAACEDGIIEPPPIDEPPPSLSNPAGTIELIELAFNHRNINELESCLTGDFTFHFDPEVIGNPVGDYTIPESWASDDFLNAVINIFSNAYSIDMSIASANVGEPDPNDAYYTADGVQMRFLVMVDAENGYLAQGFATFEFRGEYNEKNEKEWLVTAWKDFTTVVDSGDRYIDEASFGEILVWFRKP
jgi:hypothetical protein